MKVCHVCGYSCADDDQLCPICGAELRESEIKETSESEEMDIVIENPQLAASVSDPVTAEIFCDQLKENGILFSMDEADLSSSMRMGFGGFYAEINIYVADEDLEKAKEIFENLQTKEPIFEDETDGEI